MSPSQRVTLITQTNMRCPAKTKFPVSGKLSSKSPISGLQRESGDFACESESAKGGQSWAVSNNALSALAENDV